MKFLYLNIFLYLCLVINEVRVARYNYFFISNTGNKKPYSLSSIDSHLSLRYGFFIVLLYKLNRKKNFQSFTQKQLVRYPILSKQRVSNVLPNNSRPSEEIETDKNCQRNTMEYSGMLSRWMARPREWLID